MRKQCYNEIFFNLWGTKSILLLISLKNFAQELTPICVIRYGFQPTQNPALSSLHKSSRKFSLSYNGSPFFSRKTNIPEPNEAKPTDLSLWPWLPTHWGGNQEPCWQATWFWIQQFWEFHTGEFVKAKNGVFLCFFWRGGAGGGGGAEVGRRYLPCIPQWHFHSTGWGLPHPGMTALQGSTFSPLPSSLGIICDLKQGRTRIRRTSFYELLSRFFLPNHKKHWGWCPGSLCAWSERVVAIQVEEQL